MNQEFEQLRKRFLENYKKACPIMTVLGDEVRQEIFLKWDIYLALQFHTI